MLLFFWCPYLDRESPLLEAQDWEGRTAVHIASQKGDMACLELLIGAGLSIHEKMDWGWSCLMLACDGGHTECISALLHHKADVTARRSDGSTAALVLGKTNQIETGQTMIAALEALLDADPLVTELIVSDVENASQRTLLHFIAGNVHMRMETIHVVIKFLMERMADPNQKGRERRT